jgi:uncharacterized membrane protein SpoIIM required for sporulation
MRVGDLLEKRRADWTELEKLCDEGTSKKNAETASRLAALYRGACSDLAMAEVYRLPPITVEYLHRLVARAHNQLYRSRRFDWDGWVHAIGVDMPRTIFSDPCVHVAAVVFFGLFALGAFLGNAESMFPSFAVQICSQEQLDQLEDMYEEPLAGNFDTYAQMAAFYIQHNTSIGLNCFGKGPLIIPCIIELAYQGVLLGTMFGYMARPDVGPGQHFFEFVTAHGPFELTAIALSAAAGLRLGVGLVATAGLMRIESFKKHALRSLPVGFAAVALFFFAALTEGFISPSPLPYAFKALWAVVTSTAMMYYFVILGRPKGEDDGA